MEVSCTGLVEKGFLDKTELGRGAMNLLGAQEVWSDGGLQFSFTPPGALPSGFCVALFGTPGFGGGGC